MKRFRKHFALLLCLIMALTIVSGCKSSTDKEDTAKSKETVGEKTTEKSSDAKETKDAEELEEITLTMFTHLPDRATGLGLLEQTVIDMYMAENPNITVKVEALEGEAYKQKITAYLASDELPDLFNVWGSSTFLDPITLNGYAAELNPADYADYNFIPNSMDGFSKDGKLYGLPKILDFMVMYYNKDIFKTHNIAIPDTFEELTASIKTFRDSDISPVAFDGKDGWPLGILIQEILVKQTGNQDLIYDIVDGKVSALESAELLEAAKTLQEMTDNKMFQDSYLSADYGGAVNLFGQERAAMYYMGSWEVGLATSDAYTETFNENVAVMPVPAFENGKGSKTNLLAWYGGGVAVAEHSENKEEAIKLLNYIMQPDVWAKTAWQTGIAMPAQEFSTYFTGEETDMQVEIVKILEDGTDTSGTVWIDYSSPSFKTDVMNLTQQLAVSLITPEEYVKGIDKAVQDQ